MEKVENKKNYSELFSELLGLNNQYKLILTELASRGIEDVKSSAKQWSDEKIEALEKRAEQIAGKIKGAGEVALGLGILGAEAGIRGTKLAIKGAKTLYSSTKNKVDRLQLRATMYQVGLKRDARKAARDAKQFAKDKKQEVKDFVNDQKKEAGKWVKGKVDDVKDFADSVSIVGNFIKGEVKDSAERWVNDKVNSAKGWVDGRIEDVNSAKKTVINGAKSLGQKFTKKIDNAKTFVNDQKKEAGNWVKGKVSEVQDFADSAKIVKDFVKSELSSKKDDIIKNSKVKAGEFIDTAKQAKDRFEQRKNKTLLGAVRGVKSIATALEGKLEERILSDKEKTEKAQQKQPQKKQTKEMGMEME